MLQGHNGAETPSGEHVKLRIGIPLREGGGIRWVRNWGRTLKNKKWRRRKWILPLEAYPLTVDKWINQDYWRPSAASTVTSGKKRILEVNLEMQTHHLRWKMKHNSTDDLDWNDKDLYTPVLMPGIMMDTGAGEACNTPPSNSPQSQI